MRLHGSDSSSWVAIAALAMIVIGIRGDLLCNAVLPSNGGNGIVGTSILCIFPLPQMRFQLEIPAVFIALDEFIDPATRRISIESLVNKDLDQML